MTQVDERLAKVGQNLKKFISESKYKTQVSFALDGMGQDPSVIRRWIKHGVNSLSRLSDIVVSEVHTSFSAFYYFHFFHGVDHAAHSGFA